MEKRKFLPNSPTLFNVGTGMGTLSACFKFDVPDSMEGIMDVAKKAALVMKFGGGVGYALSDIRPKDSMIKTTHGMACGPISVMKVYHSIAKDMVTQGGRREGAQMGILHADHLDFEEFIHCKDDDPQKLSTFNISVAVPDGKDKDFFRPLAESAWRTGDPGVYFIDRAERDNPTPHLGKLTGTNPCGEVPLLDNEACNLGSINLGAFVGNDGKILYDDLRETIRLAVRYLNEILDINRFPVQEIEDAVQATRKIGLGVMGWADMLAMLGIRYDSFEAIDLADEIGSLLRKEAVYESGLLAVRDDAYPAWDASQPYQRNATTLCIAPTGSIALLAGASSGIEPHYAREWDRIMGDGTIIKETIPDFDGFVPPIAKEIDWEWHIKHQAAWQDHVDLAVSKTINMPESATVGDIQDAYWMAYTMGCKGVTVYRDNSRDFQVLNDGGVKEDKKSFLVNEGFESPPPPPKETNGKRTRLPTTRDSKTHKLTIGDFEGYITVGLYSAGKPGELFIQAHKEGSTVSGLLDTIGVLTSLLLQHGVPLSDFAPKLIGSSFEPSGFTGNPDVPSARSVVDYIFRWMMKQFNNGESHSTVHGGICPDCHAMTALQEGCEKCLSCGWSKC